ncbi:MAG: nitronate monooxygenase [Solirubrobacteraceae bacterium]
MTTLPFPRLRHPIIQAPMAGGPSTPELTAAVSRAGGLGFLAAGYKLPGAVEEEITLTRSLAQAPFGINLFLVSEPATDPAAIEKYARSLRGDADHYGVTLGEPRFDDDAFAAKLDIVLAERVPIVSFTFGCPSPELVARLHEHKIAVWVTVTELDEARQAVAAGADALVAQGAEAGGHRGSFVDVDGRGEVSLLPLLALIGEACDLPLVASGGIADGAGVAAVLAAGARAAQIGTGFMRCPESGTSAVQLQTLTQAGPTALTRAFTGRRARGIVNRFMRTHDRHAPSAYPQLHHLTAPLRAAARATGDPDAVNLWAGETHQLARELPASELVHLFSDDARVALARAARQIAGEP